MNYQPIPAPKKRKVPVWVWIVAPVAFLVMCCGGIGAIMTAANNTDPVSETSTSASVPGENVNPVNEVPATTEAAPPVEEPPAMTLSQEQAKRQAESYLGFMAFSRQGLIEQLEFEGFSTEDATYGVDAVGADWMEQAAKKAQNYLDLRGFSRQGLIDQLIYEKFTQEEAEYGATAVGL